MDSDNTNNFKQEVDSWIKGFQKEVSLFSTEMDDLSDEFSKQKEEHMLFYEHLDRVEQKVDLLQDSFERLAHVLHGKQPLTNIQSLKERQF